jgi:hypothetical protein
VLADNQAKHSVAEELEPLVVLWRCVRIALPGGAMRQSTFEQLGLGKMIRQRLLQLSELLVCRRRGPELLGHRDIGLRLGSRLRGGLLFGLIGALFATALQRASNCGAVGVRAGSFAVFLQRLVIAA